MEVRQSSSYPKLAAATPVKPSAPDWVWSENRKLLPTVFQEIQALCSRELTLDAAANDNGDNALLFAPISAAHQILLCQRSILVTSASMRLSHS